MGTNSPAQNFGNNRSLTYTALQARQYLTGVKAASNILTAALFAGCAAVTVAFSKIPD